MSETNEKTREAYVEKAWKSFLEKRFGNKTLITGGFAKYVGKLESELDPTRSHKIILGEEK